MKDRFKQFLLAFLILVIIGILLFFNYYYFKLSPKMLVNQQYKQALNCFEKENKLDNLKLNSRHSLGDVYYTAVDDEFTYVFSDSCRQIDKIKTNDLNYNKVLDKISEEFNNLDNRVVLSYFKDKVVYVAINTEVEVFYDFDNFEEIFRYRKGISD